MLGEPLLNVSVAICRPTPPAFAASAAASETRGTSHAHNDTTARARGQFEHTEFPSDEQAALARAAANEMSLLLRQAQRDAEWYGNDGEEDGEASKEEELAELAQVAAVSATSRATLRSAWAAHGSLGAELSAAVLIADDDERLLELLRQSDAFDASLAPVVASSHSEGSSVGLRSLNWQMDDESRESIGLTPILMACQLGRSRSVAALLRHNAALAPPRPELLVGRLSTLADAVRGSEVLPWVLAAEGGHVEVTRLLTAPFRRVVHRAARGGKSELVGRLLRLCLERVEPSAAGALSSCAAVLDGRGDDGASLLVVASVRGDAELAREVLALGAVADRPTEGGLTPLHLASMHCHVPVVERLLEAGAESERAVGGSERKRLKAQLSQKAGGGKLLASTLVEQISPPCQHEHDEMELLRLLGAAGRRVPQRRSAPRTSRHLPPGEELMHLIMNPQPIRAMGDGEDAEEEDEETNGAKASAPQLLHERPYLASYHSVALGSSPLMLAVQTWQTEVVVLLLKLGVDVDATDVAGSTPLMVAASSMNLELVQLLLAAGANATHTARAGQWMGRTAVEIAQRARRLGHDNSRSGYHPSWDQVVSLLLRQATSNAAAEDGDKEEGMAEGVAEVKAEVEAEAETEAMVEEVEVEADARPREEVAADEEAAAASGSEGEATEEELDQGKYAACALENIRWTPEVRLYGAGHGLGRGLSLLGREFVDEADVHSAFDGAKAMAHMLLDVYPTELVEVEPPLEFEEHEGASGGSCATGARGASTSGAPALDVPRLWRQDDVVALLDEPVASAPPSAAARVPALAPKKAAALGRIAPGSKDPRKLKRGPSTGGGGPFGAITG